MTIFIIFFQLMTAQAYYGRHSTEAILVYQAEADLPLGFLPKVEALQKEGRVRTITLAALDTQIQHLMGAFQAQSFIKEFRSPGVLGERYEIDFLKSEPSPSKEKGRVRLHYRFRGKVVFGKNAFKSNRIRTVPIKLPLQPDRIFEISFGDKKVGSYNYCTDADYNDFEDFWYFWDPEQKGCPLAGDQVNLLRVEGKLKMLENTKLSYPDYDKLYGDNFNGNNFDVAAFFGYIGDVNSLKKTPRKDDAKAAMKYLENELVAMGFTQTEKKNAFRIYKDGRETKGINYLRKYEKTVRMMGKPVNVRVFSLLADTDISSKDTTFHRYFVGAMKNADVVLYDGHSGLGETLDLSSLPRFKFNPNKYQVFFFNGCSSYPYYTGSFFDSKGGTQNLEVISAGLPTFSTNSGPNAVAFLNEFLEGKQKSYQTILSELEGSSVDKGWFLMGVSGDEDNQWRPR